MRNIPISCVSTAISPDVGIKLFLRETAILAVHVQILFDFNLPSAEISKTDFDARVERSVPGLLSVDFKVLAVGPVRNKKLRCRQFPATALPDGIQTMVPVVQVHLSILESRNLDKRRGPNTPFSGVEVERLAIKDSPSGGIISHTTDLLPVAEGWLCWDKQTEFHTPEYRRCPIHLLGHTANRLGG